MKAKHIFLFLTYSLLISSCVEDYIYESEGVQLSTVQHRLYTETTSLTFSKEGGTQSITIQSENTSWELTGLPGWIMASTTKGNGTATITLTATENTSVNESRSAVITLTSAASDYQCSQTVTITQTAEPVSITPESETLTFSSAAGTKTIGIVSNVDWEAECKASWVTLLKTGNTGIQITVEENLGSARNATIYLKRKGTNTALSSISLTQSESGVIGSDDFGSDETWGPDDQSQGDMNQDDFGNDENWN